MRDENFQKIFFPTNLCKTLKQSILILTVFFNSKIMNHVLSASQFNRKDLEKIFGQAQKMEAIIKEGGCDLAKGKILATLFYEPSTRTRLSIETAMIRLGGNIISETDVSFSSQIKGEVLQDTARIIGGYSDIVAIRSKNVGDADIMAEYSGVPVVNGGDGSGEHPTQSLLDIYTIFKHFDLDKPLTVSFVGELICGRTVHSLSVLLRNFPNIKINFVSPEALQIPDKYFKPELGDQKFEDLNDEVLKGSDVIYNTRIQKERISEAVFEKYKTAFHFNVEKVSGMKDSAILMHPLPRVNEISQEVDNLPQAKYFEQAQNGIPVRMALMADLLKLI